MPEDARQIIGDYISLSTDETTVLRKEPVRLRINVYTGTTDADATTDVTLRYLPRTAVVVGVLAMINQSASVLWSVHGYRDASSAANAYRVELNEVAAPAERQVRLAEVGANLQGLPYRLSVLWVERL